MSDQDLMNIRSEVEVLKREVQVLSKEVSSMHVDVKTLVKGEARREGMEEEAARSAAKTINANHERGAWYRAFLPLGAAAGAASLLAWIAYVFNGNGQ